MAGPPRKQDGVRSKGGPPRGGVVRDPPILNLPRGNEALRDLEDPTHAFPIKRHKGSVERRAPGDYTDEDVLMLDSPIRVEDEDDASYAELTPRRPSVDLRLVALWLAIATLLAMLVGLAMAAAVVYR